MTVTTILDSLKMTATLLSRLSHFRLSELTVYLCSMRMEVCDVLSSTIKKKREENERREEESSQENSSVFARHSVRRCRELFFQRSFYEMELLSPSLSLFPPFSLSLSTRATSQLLGTSTELALIFCLRSRRHRERNAIAPSCNS